MRMLLLLSLLLISFSFNGCGREDPVPCTPKQIFVKSKVPKLRILYEVPVYEITDFKRLDDKYSKVNTEQLYGASRASQHRIKNIKFYERQIRSFNKKFKG